MKTVDVCIIGAGPAGIATAIQLKRSGIDPVVFEKSHVGGLLNNANLVENYPGYAKGISGIELVGEFKKHLEILGTKINREEVISLDYCKNLFTVKTAERTLQSKIVVVASGTKAKPIPDFGSNDYTRKNVYSEIYPVLEVKSQHIIIIGGGDAAFDYALNLGKRNKVTILNRSSEIKSLPLLYKRAKKMKSIHYIDNAEIVFVLRISPDILIVEYKTSKRIVKAVANYIISAVGREPQLGFCSKSFMKKINKLESDNRLFFVGDVRNENFRQTAIAVGDGIKTAMKISKYLKGEPV